MANFPKSPPGMLEDSSNQTLLAAWQGGDQQAAQVLVRRFMVRLTALARSRLSRRLARRLDPEDIVLSAWRSFFVAAENGGVAIPTDDNLWPLLVTMTLRKLARQATRHGAQQRDVDAEVNFDIESRWQAVVSREPSPEQAALVVDEVESLMASLSPNDRDVLTRLLQGDSQSTIASALHCSERSVRRSVQRIRDRFEESHGGSDPDIAIDRMAGPQTGAMEHAATAFPSVHSTPPSEQTISDSEFVLQKLIGQGGFGKVYLASRVSDGALVAVKFLKKRFWKDARSVQSMLDETARVSLLSHPNIIRHDGWGRTARGAVFIVMEWIHGTDAGEWQRVLQPSLRAILECGLVIADALGAAHEAGIIHGDVTPGNVLRRSDGTFVLTDFGFARSLNHPQPASLGGTPGFLAPEQVSDVFGSVSERTDVYGLGGLLYALLTGRPPMTGQDVPDVLANVLSSSAPTPVSQNEAGVPPELDRLILHCLQKEASARPASVAEVRASLRAMQRVLNVD